MWALQASLGYVRLCQQSPSHLPASLQSTLDDPWNWNAYLFPLWCLGVLVRNLILFPLRCKKAGNVWYYACYFPPRVCSVLCGFPDLQWCHLCCTCTKRLIAHCLTCRLIVLLLSFVLFVAAFALVGLLLPKVRVELTSPLLLLSSKGAVVANAQSGRWAA